MNLKVRTKLCSVYEFKPSCRSILFKKKFHRVSFPYLIFLVHHSAEKLELYYRDAPLLKWNDFLYAPTLPNILSGSMRRKGVCMEPCYFNGDKDGHAERFIANFWQSKFKVDEYTYYCYRKSGIKIPDWAEKTAADPEFWKKLQFRRLFKMSDLFNIHLTFEVNELEA